LILLSSSESSSRSTSVKLRALETITVAQPCETPSGFVNDPYFFSSSVATAASPSCASNRAKPATPTQARWLPRKVSPRDPVNNRVNQLVADAEFLREVNAVFPITFAFPDFDYLIRREFAVG
jgi:hypothetical protein